MPTPSTYPPLTPAAKKRGYACDVTPDGVLVRNVLMSSYLQQGEREKFKFYDWDGNLVGEYLDPPKDVDGEWYNLAVNTFNVRRSKGKIGAHVFDGEHWGADKKIGGQVTLLAHDEPWCVADLLLTRPETISAFARGELPNISIEADVENYFLWGLALIRADEGHFSEEIPDFVPADPVKLFADIEAKLGFDAKLFPAQKTGAPKVSAHSLDTGDVAMMSRRRVALLTCSAPKGPKKETTAMDEDTKKALAGLTEAVTTLSKTVESVAARQQNLETAVKLNGGAAPAQSTEAQLAAKHAQDLAAKDIEVKKALWQAKVREEALRLSSTAKHLPADKVLTDLSAVKEGDEAALAEAVKRLGASPAAPQDKLDLSMPQPAADAAVNADKNSREWPRLQLKAKIDAHIEKFKCSRPEAAQAVLKANPELELQMLARENAHDLMQCAKNTGIPYEKLAKYAQAA